MVELVSQYNSTNPVPRQYGRLDQLTPRFTPVHQFKYWENGYVRGKIHQAIDCCLMVHIYSLCPQGLFRKPPFLLASTRIFYIGSSISQGSQPFQYKSLPEDGPPALFLDRHPSMTACTMDSFEALHTFIARQYCWSRRTYSIESGRADTSVNPRGPFARFYFRRRSGRTIIMQLTIIAIITPLTFSDIRMCQGR
jgi:hypothetical protein